MFTLQFAARVTGRPRAVLAFFFLMLLGLQQASAASYEELTVRLVPVKLADRVYFFEGDLGPISTGNNGYNSNAGFVITDDGVVVFDVLGTPALGAEMLRQIRLLTDQPVRRVIISHYHADHFYGLQPFKDAGAEIWAHRRVRDYLATDAPARRLEERRNSLAPWVNETSRVIAPDVYLDGDTDFRLGGITFRIFQVGPAHTAEDLMMLAQEPGVLFAGDLMFVGRVPFVGDADSKGWLQSIERLIQSKPKMIVGGHGAASSNAAHDLAMTRDYLRFLRAEMGKGVDEMMSFEETYQRVDWSRFAALPAFNAANRRNAYNTFILMEKEALAGK